MLLRFRTSRHYERDRQKLLPRDIVDTWQPTPFLRQQPPGTFRDRREAGHRTEGYDTPASSADGGNNEGWPALMSTLLTPDDGREDPALSGKPSLCVSASMISTRSLRTSQS